MRINHLILFAGIVIFIYAAGAAFPEPIVSDSLQARLEKDSVAKVIIELVQSPQAVFTQFKTRSFESRSSKIVALINSLKEHAQFTQKPILDILAAQGVKEYKSFWISNRIYVPECTAALISTLRTHESIGQIREELNIKLLEMKDATKSGSFENLEICNSFFEPEWGVEAVGAPEAWKCGARGEGVVVATIDTGVRPTHFALKKNFAGYWFDPGTNSPVPYDLQGHGTHTLGSLCGHDGFGVAPGATWISCSGCQPNGCFESYLLACGQFILCPSNPNIVETDKKVTTMCKGVPDVVSNSWGGSGYDPFYESTVDAWRLAEIFPVFANGNSGPGCGTSGSPGRYPTVVSVGAITINDTLANFSSRSLTNETVPVGTFYKPDVVGPGVGVTSGWCYGDKDLLTISGTSMATPHVAGVVALMMSSCKESRDFDVIKSSLLKGAVTDGLQRPATVCETENLNSSKPMVYPNNEFGMGLVNAKRSIKDYCSKSKSCPC